MTTVIILLIAVIILLCMPQQERPRTAGRLLLIGLPIWALITFKVTDFLDGLIAALFFRLWNKGVYVLFWGGGLFFTFWIGIFVHAFIRDRLDNRAIRKEWQGSKGKVRAKFDQRVEEYLRLGWDKEKAERVTMDIANPNDNQ